MREDNLLGFCANRGPDAASLVFQVWVVSRKPVEILEWTQGLIKTTTRSFENLETNVENSQVLLIVSLSVLIVLLAIAIYVFN